MIILYTPIVKRNITQLYESCISGSNPDGSAIYSLDVMHSIIRFERICTGWNPVESTNLCPVRLKVRMVDSQSIDTSSILVQGAKIPY